MKLLSLFVLASVALQAPPTEVEAPPFEGDLAEGLASMERLSADDQAAEAMAISETLLAPNGFTRWRRELEAEESRVIAPALGLADPLFERLGLNGYPEELRAEVLYARGLVQLAAGEREAAEGEFADARVGAGPGELRLCASYNRGTAALLEAEEWRAQIPEISGQPAPPAAAPGMPPLPGLPGAGPGAGGDEPPDPLQVARGHYVRAREALVDRLRLDWRDADTRANVELIQRRLNELDEIERQREEQQQDQQQQDQQQDSQDQQQDSQDQQDESEQEQSEQEPEQPAESEGEEPEPPDEEPQEGEEESSEPEEEAQPQEAEPQEVYLTREEVQRLLDRLREHEEEAEALRARLYQQNRRRVERDW